VQVATHGENTGYEVPCLIVAAKDDLDQCAQALQESTRVSVLAFNSEASLASCTHIGICLQSYLYVYYC
jgi:hypothetical protein